MGPITEQVFPRKRWRSDGQALPQLARALQANQALISLDISSCKVGVGEAKKLSAALDSNTSLQILRMSKNSIGDQGAAAVGALIENISLKYISLSHCCIRTCGAQWLADVLPKAQVCTRRKSSPMTSSQIVFLPRVSRSSPFSPNALVTRCI